MASNAQILLIIKYQMTYYIVYLSLVKCEIIFGLTEENYNIKMGV